MEVKSVLSLLCVITLLNTCDTIHIGPIEMIRAEAFHVYGITEIPPIAHYVHGGVIYRATLLKHNDVLIESRDLDGPYQFQGIKSLDDMGKHVNATHRTILKTLRTLLHPPAEGASKGPYPPLCILPDLKP